MKRHAVIPIFIPHEGCPNTCVFCNQHTITGKPAQAVSPTSILGTVRQALETIPPETAVQIAFYGGSFTGLPRNQMVAFLETAYRFVLSGRVQSIRLSTRPDYIDDDILVILKQYGVSHIELGFQSFSQHVLDAAERGHTAVCAKESAKKIVHAGFTLTGQMMVGLPGSTALDEVLTAIRIVRVGATGARIYPTVVFEGTKLAGMMRKGDYVPLLLDQAVVRSADCFEVFLKGGVMVHRVGLQETEDLSAPGRIVGGAHHCAMGEMVESELYRRRWHKAIAAVRHCPSLGPVTAWCAPGHASRAAGYRGQNRAEAARLLGSRARIKIKEDPAIQPYTLRLTTIENGTPCPL